MQKLENALVSLSVGDLKRLLRAKRIQTARQAAAERADELRRELAAAEQSVAKLDRTITRLLRNGRTASPPKPKRNANRAGRRPQKAGVRRGPRKGSLREFLGKQLAKLGRPATVRELAGLVQKAGYRTKSKFDVFLRAVNLALHGKPEFVRTEGKYGLAK